MIGEIQNPKSKIQNFYIAVDLGAGSGRVFLAGFDSDEMIFEEIRRFQYPPIEENNLLRWDFPLIFGEIKKGLRAASERARQLRREIYSIGVDSWAVDYGLIDHNGNLTANPVCYRDERTKNAPEKVFSQLSRSEIFAKTGIQFLPFNTVFQLFAETSETLANADKMLLLPDLINFFLTGKICAEYTNATTTQIINANAKNWDFALLEKLHLPARLLPPIVETGTDLGFLKTELAAELNLEKVRVIATATHDTASAVAGAPLAKNQAYISSGTWSLVGVERKNVLINADAERHNFTNEGGACKTIRFLKNVTGLWILESCRKEWKRRGIAADHETLSREIERIEDFEAFIFPDDERFLNPPKLPSAIENQLKETGQNFDQNPARVAKTILDSLAFRYASILRTIENLTGEKIESVQIVGGGGRNDYLNQMAANASGLPVQAGLYEATVTGNALVQAISAGRFKDLREARNYVAEHAKLKIFTPQKSEKIDSARRVYQRIEEKYTNAAAIS